MESWKYRGHRYLQRWPSRRAMQRVRDRIKAITAPRHRLPEPIGPIVAEVNHVLRHWGAYFRVGNSVRKFQAVDEYVRERLSKFLAKKAGRGGYQRKRCTAALFDKLGLYQLTGTVEWYTATPTATR
jgi:hypothetical protein